MDLQARRKLITTRPNPDSRLDYIVLLEGHLKGEAGSDTKISLRYIPDREVLVAESFGGYLDALAAEQWETPEDLAVTILSDLNNELLARWAQVAINAPESKHDALDVHGVVLEDRQPNWDNPALLGRLHRV